MLGKWIDRAALAALSAAGYYLFFLNAWGSIPGACAAAFGCCILTDHLLRRRPKRRRAGAARAREAVARVAALDDDAAAALLTPLIQRRYPGEAFRVAPALKHPEATLSSGDVLNAWKANRDAERLVIAATCPCEPRAALYARELRAPVVAVLDSRALGRLLRTDGSLPDDAPEIPLGTRLRRGFARIASARVSPRNALLAAALLAMYVIQGSPVSLLAALALLFHLGVALIQRRTARRLFDGASL